MTKWPVQKLAQVAFYKQLNRHYVFIAEVEIYQIAVDIVMTGCIFKRSFCAFHE